MIIVRDATEWQRAQLETEAFKQRSACTPDLHMDYVVNALRETTPAVSAITGEAISARS
jgi:hypothetical protein